MTLNVVVLHPTVDPAQKLTLEDVFGTVDEKTRRRNNDGMVVAGSDQVCPIWGDVVPYKSVTVVCEKEQLTDVVYWLEYVHGGGSVSRHTATKDNKIALRSDYLAW